MKGSRRYGSQLNGETHFEQRFQGVRLFHAAHRPIVVVRRAGHPDDHREDRELLARRAPRHLAHRVAGREPAEELPALVGDPPDLAVEVVGDAQSIAETMRKALEKFYPKLKEVKLLDYKVRVLPAGQGTASAIRVLIESGDKESRWGTVGVSDNIVDASYQALLDSIEYKLHKAEEAESGKK